MLTKSFSIESVNMEVGQYVFIERTNGEAEYYSNGLLFFCVKVNNLNSICVFAEDEIDYTWRTFGIDASNIRILFDKNYRDG